MKNLFVIIALLLCNVIVYGQKVSFILKGEFDEILSDATFLYGSQKGISNKEGEIKFEWDGLSTMTLSHISYGEWNLNPSMLKEVLEVGFYKASASSKSLQPLTIIALRPKQAESETVNLTYNDYLMSDGGELLTQTPVISGIRKSGVYGADPVLRGFKYDQLNIVMNGAQSATAACPNRMDPATSQMAPNMIDNVEIIKGPYALRYGNGIGGTVNYNSFQPIFLSKPAIYGRVSGRYDTNGQIYRSEAMLATTSKNHNLSITGSFAGGNDYKDGSQNTIMSSFERNSVGLNYATKLTEEQMLNVIGFHNWANDTDFPSLMMDLRKDRTSLVNAKHTIQLDYKSLKSIETTGYATIVDHLMDNLLKPLDPRMMNASTDANTLNFGARSEAKLSLGKINGYIGLDFKSASTDGYRTREFLLGPMAGKTVIDNVWQDSEVNATAFFTELSKSWGSTKAVFSGRVEYNNSSINNPSDSFLSLYEDLQEQQINPSISIGILKNMPKNIAIGIWAARTQRSAGLTERFINQFPVGLDPYEMLGNPNLSPEINNQIDVTLEWKSKTHHMSLDLFYAYTQDYISSVIDENIATIMPNSPGVRRYTNLGAVYRTGFEFNYRQDITTWLNHDFQVAYTYAQDIDQSEPLPEIAPLDLRYKLQANFEKLFTSVNFRYVADQNRVSIEYGESQTPGFQLIDFNIGYKTSKNIQIQAGIQNLFDVTYAEHLSRNTLAGNSGILNARGRNIFVSTNIRF